MLKIIYRACDVVNSLHGSLDGSFNPRPLNLSKKDVIKICLQSLVDCLKTIDEQYEVHVIGDRVTDDTWNFINKKLNPKTSFNSQEALRDSGSLLKCSELAMKFIDEDFIYFVEDDYLHNKETFWQKLKDFKNFANENLNAPWFIHPTDYPDQYNRLLKRCLIFQTPSGYWREVANTTHTFMCYKKFYKLFVDHFRECHKEDGNDGALSEIFQKNALCFSPLPGIATHLHNGTYSNYVDWFKILKEIQEELK
jgi:hypothetical protein